MWSPKTAQVIMFRPQFIYMWVMSRSHRLGPKLSLVCLLQALIREPPSGFPQLPYVSLCFSLYLSLPNFSNPLLFTLFHLLQSLVSGVIIIIFPLHAYSHVHQNPKGSSQLQRILLELIPDAKQCSAMNFSNGTTSPRLSTSLCSHLILTSLVIGQC